MGCSEDNVSSAFGKVFFRFKSLSLTPIHASPTLQQPSSSSKKTRVLPLFEQNCDLVALKVPKVHITNIKQHAADQAAKAAEETELEEEQALYDYENR